LELLVTKAGLTPMQAIVLGTHTAAGLLGLDELGMVGPGQSADFLVHDANPLDDIANTRRISKVYLRGQEIPRAALSAKWQAKNAQLTKRVVGSPCCAGCRRRVVRRPPRLEVQPPRLGVPRMWVLGGSITSSNSCVNIAAAKKATARNVSVPTVAW
jgi:hypothetical protein